MPNYGNGKIYRVWETSYAKCYVGSTTETLALRMAKHRCYYRFWAEGRDLHKKATVYDLFDEYGVDNCKIELLENFPCGSKSELEAQEGYHIRNNNCVNKRIEGRSKIEYRFDHKDKMKEYNDIYRVVKKEEITEQRKGYREQNKEKIFDSKKQYRENNKEQIAEKKKGYYENNKEQIAEKKKDYYENNKEAINARRREQRKTNGNYKPA